MLLELLVRGWNQRKPRRTRRRRGRPCRQLAAHAQQPVHLGPFPFFHAPGFASRHCSCALTNWDGITHFMQRPA